MSPGAPRPPDEAHLVGGVEEAQEPPLQARLEDALPLFPGRVDAGRVVGACVQQHDRPWLRGGEVGEHAGVVEAASVAVVVPVRLDGEAAGGEDLVVVAPGGLADVDGLGGVELGEELGGDAEGAGAAEGLGSHDAALSDRWMVAEGQLLGEFAELG